METPNLIALSQEFLLEVKKGNTVEEQIFQLQKCSASAFLNELTTDALRTTFWVNIYNAYTRYFLEKNPELIHSLFSRAMHFNTRKINIGGERLSLDDIEHGILRGLRWRLFHQLINVFRKAEFVNKMVVRKPDPRVHFALSCGGKSCPPVRFYEDDKLDEQLEAATRNFISSEAVYIQSVNTLKISKLFKWYCSDFGGEEGIVAFLKERKVLPEEASPLLRYNSYEWE